MGKGVFIMQDMAKGAGNIMMHSGQGRRYYHDA
jgi:hypothetical protein